MNCERVVSLTYMVQYSHIFLLIGSEWKTIILFKIDFLHFFKFSDKQVSQIFFYQLKTNFLDI